MQANAKSSLCDCAKSRTPDNADTKEGNTTNNITTAKGMRDHNFALVLSSKLNTASSVTLKQVFYSA